MIGQEAGKDFAYILGVYLGDGCVTKRSGSNKVCFRLNTIDQDFAEAVRGSWERLTGVSGYLTCYPVSKSSKPNWAFGASGDEMCERLVNDTNRKKTIPAYVFGWPCAQKLAFIAGLMDSEGFVAANRNHTGRRFYMGYKSCDPWVMDFVRLLNSVGILIGKIGVERPAKVHYKTPRRFTIKMQSWIDSGARFNIARKQRRVDEWAETEPHPLGLNFRAKSTPETICSAPGNGMKT